MKFSLELAITNLLQYVGVALTGSAKTGPAEM